MYDTFDNGYQATIGIDFLSKTMVGNRFVYLDVVIDTSLVRMSFWTVIQCACNCGIRPAKRYDGLQTNMKENVVPVIITSRTVALPLVDSGLHSQLGSGDCGL